MVKMLSPLARVAALGSNCVSSFGGCSSSTRALSDVRRSPSWRALRRAERWSGGVGSGSPVRGKSTEASSSSSSGSTRKLGRTGVISKKPAARCHDRAKLLMLFTPPASPIAPICCEMEDLRLVSLGLYNQKVWHLLTAVCATRVAPWTRSPRLPCFLRLVFSRGGPTARDWRWSPRSRGGRPRTCPRWTAAFL